MCALVALTLNVAPTAEARPLDEIKRRGEIRIAVVPEAAPRSFYGGAEPRGFDVDIGRGIAKRLGVRATFVPISVQKRLESLQLDRADISLGALTRTPERAKVIDFTIALNTDAISVLTTESTGIRSARELNDARITLVDVRGYASVQLIREKFPKAKLVLVANDAEALHLLAKGSAHALIEDIAAYVPLMKDHPNVKWLTLNEPVHVGYTAIGVAKGNAELRRELNRALAELHRSGYVQYAWKKWYSRPMHGTIDVDAELAAAE